MLCIPGQRGAPHKVPKELQMLPADLRIGDVLRPAGDSRRSIVLQTTTKTGRYSGGTHETKLHLHVSNLFPVYTLPYYRCITHSHAMFAHLFAQVSLLLICPSQRLLLLSDDMRIRVSTLPGLQPQRTHVLHESRATGLQAATLLKESQTETETRTVLPGAQIFAVLFQALYHGKSTLLCIHNYIVLVLMTHNDKL